MKLKKCNSCQRYTLKDKCPKKTCENKTISAHYKFIQFSRGKNEFKI